MTLQESGDGDGVADDRVLDVLGTPEVSRHDHPAVDPDPGAENGPAADGRERAEPGRAPLPVELAQACAHGQGAPHRPLGVVRLVRRGVEHRHDTVAEELDDAAAMGLQHLGHGAEVGVQQLDHLRRRQPLGQRRVAPQVADEGRDLALLASGPDAIGGGQRPAYHLRVDVAPEGGPDVLPLLEPPSHALEPPAEDAELVASGHERAGVEAPVLDRRGGGDDLVERPAHVAGHHPGDTAQEKRSDRVGCQSDLEHRGPDLLEVPSPHVDSGDGHRLARSRPPPARRPTGSDPNGPPPAPPRPPPAPAPPPSSAPGPPRRARRAWPAFPPGPSRQRSSATWGRRWGAARKRSPPTHGADRRWRGARAGPRAPWR